MSIYKGDKLIAGAGYSPTVIIDEITKEWVVNGESTGMSSVGLQGDKGDTGKGISSVDYLYLATSISDVSNLPSLTDSQWTSSIQTLTNTNRYLWVSKKYNYTDNTTQEIQPVIVGIYGDKGDTGTGISSIVKASEDAINKTITYDILMTNGNKYSFTVQQGIDGVDGTVSFDNLTEEQRLMLKGDPGTTDYNELTNAPNISSNNVVTYQSDTTVKQLRNIFLSTTEPTDSDGVDGDIWIIYEEV